MKPDIRIYIYLTRIEYSKLILLCKKDKSNISEYVRKLIKENLELNKIDLCENYKRIFAGCLNNLDQLAKKESRHEESIKELKHGISFFELDVRNYIAVPLHTIKSKKVFSDKNTKRIKVRIDPDFKKQFETKCSALNIGQSTYIKKAIRIDYENQCYPKKFYEAMEMFYSLSKELNQLTAKANATGYIDGQWFIRLNEQMKKIIADVKMIIKEK